MRDLSSAKTVMSSHQESLARCISVHSAVSAADRALQQMLIEELKTRGGYELGVSLSSDAIEDELDRSSARCRLCALQGRYLRSRRQRTNALR